MVLTAHLAVDAIHERPEVMAHIAILHHIGRKVHRERLEGGKTVIGRHPSLSREEAPNAYLDVADEVKIDCD